MMRSRLTSRRANATSGCALWAVADHLQPLGVQLTRMTRKQSIDIAIKYAAGRPSILGQ